MAQNSRKATPGGTGPGLSGPGPKRSGGPTDPRGDGSTPAEGEPSSDLATRLLAHYLTTRRHLPWRQDTDPYRVWVSEVMLQQTRVETVVPYYRRWLERFPTLGSLAEAPEDDVLKQWEGLGYYSRARNLQRAARLVRERHAGTLPSDPQLLRELPGFGAYTVGAVASIAFGHALPAVDGNVRRVLARLYDVAQPSAEWLRRTAATLLPAEAPGDFNQALMEFGATICTPRAPLCPTCPLADLCLARVRGTVTERPGRKARAAVRTVELGTAVVGDAGGRLLLVRNPDGGLLAGLWGFPSAEIAPGEGAAAAAARAAGAAGVRVQAAAGRALPGVRHNFSHLRALYRPVVFTVKGRRARSGGEASWVTAGELGDRALPVAQRRIAELWAGERSRSLPRAPADGASPTPAAWALPAPDPAPAA